MKFLKNEIIGFEWDYQRILNNLFYDKKTRFKLNKITKVVTDVILMVKTPVFESKCLQSEKVIFDQKYVFRHQNSHF